MNYYKQSIINIPRNKQYNVITVSNLFYHMSIQIHLISICIVVTDIAHNYEPGLRGFNLNYITESNTLLVHDELAIARTYLCYIIFYLVDLSSQKPWKDSLGLCYKQLGVWCYTDILSLDSSPVS